MGNLELYASPDEIRTRILPKVNVEMYIVSSPLINILKKYATLEDSFELSEDGLDEKIIFINKEIGEIKNLRSMKHQKYSRCWNNI